MAKMTKARVDRWNKDLRKAAELVRKTSQDVGSAKLTTSGSIYSGLIEVGHSLAPVVASLEIATSDDSGVERIRKTVVDAADQRKAAKAAKDAEKAAAS